MEILKEFGFDPIMLVAQILNFLIIFYILKRFMYKPVISLLKKREDDIKKSALQAEEARVTLEKTLEKEKKILSNAQIEAKSILEDAKNQALIIAREVEENAKKETEKMISTAKETIQQEAKETEAKLTEKISIIASNMLEKALEGSFNEKDQKQIIDKTIKNIKSNDK